MWCGYVGLAEIAGALEQTPNPPLQNVSFYGAGITGAGMVVLANALKTNTTLYQLDLSSNSCGDDGPSALV